MPNYVPATIEDGVEPREEPLELLDGKRARLVAEVGAGQGERAARAEAAHLADEGVVGDPGRRVVRFHLILETSCNHSNPLALNKGKKFSAEKVSRAVMQCNNDQCALSFSTGRTITSQTWI